MLQCVQKPAVKAVAGSDGVYWFYFWRVDPNQSLVYIQIRSADISDNDYAFAHFVDEILFCFYCKFYEYGIAVI